MVTTAKILKYDGTNLLLLPDDPIGRELSQKNIGSVEIRLNDGRTISNEQRRKIFALIRDISNWSGHEPEYIRKHMTWDFCEIFGCDWFSLSDVDMTTAKELINFLIAFCFDWDVPTNDTMLNRTDDIGRYLYMCLEHRKCVVCNKRAEVHHVDRVGMGSDRERIVHVGLKAIALCHEHHMEAHWDEQKMFDLYHIYGIPLDEYLCGCLRLNTKQK